MVKRIPALVDIHVHFRDPGFPEKEDISSGCRAAAAGGYLAVCMMPNTSPAIDSRAALLGVDLKGREYAGEGGVRVFAASAMTTGQAGRELVDFDAMDKADTLCKALTGHGVCGISEDGKTLHDETLMDGVCAAAAALDLPVFDHAEPEAEVVRRDIALAKKTGARFHIQHISLAESVRLIRAAKAEGVPVTCETAPHYFVLTKQDTAADRLGVNAKMNPPLALDADRQAILNGLADGTIDCIATDHAPHEPAAKNLPYIDAANGIIGLETAFAVSYTALVKSGLIGLEDLVRLMSTKPAEIIGLTLGDDDFAEVEISAPWIIDKEAFFSKGRNTPFDGMRVYGRVVRTVSGGRTVYQAP